MRIDGADIRLFVDRLKKAIECINSTLSCAPDFEEVIQTCKGLQCVFVRNFVGIGAVRLVNHLFPPFSPVPGQLTEYFNEKDTSQLSFEASIWQTK